MRNKLCKGIKRSESNSPKTVEKIPRRAREIAGKKISRHARFCSKSNKPRLIQFDTRKGASDRAGLRAIRNGSKCRKSATSKLDPMVAQLVRSDSISDWPRQRSIRDDSIVKMPEASVGIFDLEKLCNSNGLPQTAKSTTNVCTPLLAEPKTESQVPNLLEFFAESKKSEFVEAAANKSKPCCMRLFVEEATPKCAGSGAGNSESRRRQPDSSDVKP